MHGAPTTEETITMTIGPLSDILKRHSVARVSQQLQPLWCCTAQHTPARRLATEMPGTCHEKSRHLSYVGLVIAKVVEVGVVVVLLRWCYC